MRLLALLCVIAALTLTGGCGAQPGKAQPRAEGTPPTTEPASARVTVSVNHCFVVPVSFDSAQWNVPFEKQFGWGGMQPQHWQGTGLIVRLAENKARYSDDGGAARAPEPARLPDWVDPSGPPSAGPV